MYKPASPSTGEKYRILLVEDEADLAKMLSMLLATFDMDCRSAADGPDALREYSQWKPHLVLLDVMLPGMSGHEVCAKIRETDATPVIMLTARGEIENEVTGLKSGADDYIRKPYNTRVLAARVVALLRRAYRYDACANCDDGNADEEETTADDNGIAKRQTMKAALSALAAQSGVPKEITEPVETEIVPAGWASCERCGYMGPRQKFENQDAFGKPKAICPVCKESDFVAFSLG